MGGPYHRITRQQKRVAGSHTAVVRAAAALHRPDPGPFSAAHKHVIRGPGPRKLSPKKKNNGRMGVRCSYLCVWGGGGGQGLGKWAEPGPRTALGMALGGKDQSRPVLRSSTGAPCGSGRPPMGEARSSTAGTLRHFPGPPSMKRRGKRGGGGQWGRTGHTSLAFMAAPPPP